MYIAGVHHVYTSPLRDSPCYHFASIMHVCTADYVIASYPSSTSFIVPGAM